MEFIGPLLPDRKCGKCGDLKPLTEFYANKRGKFGKLNKCKSCSSAYSKAWRNGYSPRAVAARNAYLSLSEERKCELRSRENKNRNARRRNKPVQSMLARARKRARSLGREFTIGPIDVAIGTICPVLGIPMRTTYGTMPEPCSPSLDRIDSSRGYIPGNVCVISYRANTVKGNATIAELEAILAYMKANLPKEQSQQAA